MQIFRMIDCHAHLGEFHDRIEQVIDDAKAEGVAGVIVVPEYGKSKRPWIFFLCLQDFERNMKMCDEHPDFLFPALGLHPIQGSYAVPEESSACSLSEYDQYRASLFIKIQ